MFVSFGKSEIVLGEELRFFFFFYHQFKQKLEKTNSIEEKTNLVAEEIVKENTNMSFTDVKEASRSFYEKLIISEKYSPETMIKQDVVLIKAEQSFNGNVQMNEDLGLKEVSIFADAKIKRGRFQSSL